MHERNDDRQVGGTDGGASPPAPDDVPAGDDEESRGSGDVEVPLGVPVSGDEFRRLKEAARRARREDEDEVGAQEDAEEDQRRDDGATEG